MENFGILFVVVVEIDMGNLYLPMACLVIKIAWLGYSMVKKEKGFDIGVGTILFI